MDASTVRKPCNSLPVRPNSRVACLQRPLQPSPDVSVSTPGARGNRARCFGPGRKGTLLPAQRLLEQTKGNIRSQIVLAGNVSDKRSLAWHLSRIDLS